MRYEYKKDFEVTYSQVDRWLDLDPFNAILMVQQMNTQFFKTFRCDNITCKERDNALWVITKTRVHFERTPKMGDDITGLSASIKTHGYKTELDTAFRYGDGSLALVSRQELFVIDATSREPRKIDTLRYPEDMDYVTETLPLRFFRIKEELGEESLVYSDRYRLTDIDYSNHVNNTVYVRYALNALTPEFFERRRIVDFEIQYRHECYEGHALSVYKAELDEDTTDIQIKSDGNIAIDVRIVSRMR
ncbi:MAG: hypothetical protein ILP16_12520 [Spirochaetales bacterium]|nr:hypothetical protein [Spirochaetales bacterium]